MIPPTPVELSVPVHGGGLTALRWDGGEAAAAALPVLAVHGITANALSFGAVAAHLSARATVIAPDLRGRGASHELPGPYGLGSHVEDLVALLDHLGIDRAVLAGHSMGAFVACLAAVRHPDRFAAAVLIDGGYGLPAPPGADVDHLLGPAMARLHMEFPDRDAYRDFWCRHPAFTSPLDPAVEAYTQRDLVGREPHLRSSCSLEAVRTDGADFLTDPEVLGAVHRLPCPALLLWAGRGLLDETPGLYTEQRLAALAGTGVRTESFGDDNHYSILFGASAAALAERIAGEAQAAG
ncbi:alpha/beta hydrolase [Salinactinospora qingdaonensis]|uniref:AB hydrolase-1 domain-containing protein n=1 Tax=Salinactinospora qingdaonensis TaxID=702744 RepID=A0ABP7FN89_9ACTN